MQRHDNDADKENITSNPAQIDASNIDVSAMGQQNGGDQKRKSD